MLTIFASPLGDTFGSPEVPGVSFRGGTQNPYFLGRRVNLPYTQNPVFFVEARCDPPSPKSRPFRGVIPPLVKNPDLLGAGVRRAKTKESMDQLTSWQVITRFGSLGIEKQHSCHSHGHIGSGAHRSTPTGRAVCERKKVQGGGGCLRPPPWHQWPNETQL